VKAIFYPVLALVALTFAVGARMYVARVGAAKAGRVKVKDFRLGESANVPPEVALPNRNFMNLLETPVLFYVACVVLYVTSAVDGLALALAWAYVGARVAHSAVHLTYNDVLHRLAAFATSLALLLALWVVVAVRIAA
jgi:hypothetical protein